MVKTTNITNIDIRYRAFIRLLKNRKVYKQYINQVGLNLPIFNKYDLIDFAHGSSIKVDAQHILSKAFTWSQSKEGLAFWRDLHTEWIRSFLGIEEDDCSLLEANFRCGYCIKKQV